MLYTNLYSVVHIISPKGLPLFTQKLNFIYICILFMSDSIGCVQSSQLVFKLHPAVPTCFVAFLSIHYFHFYNFIYLVCLVFVDLNYEVS